MNRTVYKWIALLSFLLVGCGSKGKITGKVTLNGATVTKGDVVFYPVKGAPISCSINEDGTYQIEGVEAGACIVTVTQTDGASADAAGDDKKKANPDSGKGVAAQEIAVPKSGLPDKYLDTATSPLKFTIKGGKNTIDLALEH